MDYKKTNAPTNTVTHNLMDFCEGTDNLYESVAIMSKRANQIAVEMKQNLPRTTTTWKKSLKIANKSKFHVITRNCRNLH